MRELEQKRVAY